jgi:hypothetical protein
MTNADAHFDGLQNAEYCFLPSPLNYYYYYQLQELIWKKLFSNSYGSSIGYVDPAIFKSKTNQQRKQIHGGLALHFVYRRSPLLSSPPIGSLCCPLFAKAKRFSWTPVCQSPRSICSDGSNH